MAEPRYVIIHGHFYQPPRESPWTGLISSESGAAPFGNFNERILSECYTANAHAHTMDGRVVHIRNNYEALDFDFGPTLLSWLERHGKTAYRALVRADELSAKATGGHGNAIAQSYSHSILPLLDTRDLELQVTWGIEDFRARFKRAPEGMWLPECAADQATLSAVAATGVKFVILAPEQGSFRGPQAKGRAAGPFLWRDGERRLAVFRFDRAISGAIAFGDAMADGARLARLIADSAMELEPGAALLLATDGETYGHHRKTGAAELSRALALLTGRDEFRVTNCAAYLADHPATGSFEIHTASSWSCPHGVERWRADCGCRLEPATNQHWRAPLREAMEFVKRHCAAAYARFAPDLVEEPGSALTESVRLFIDPSPALREEFFVRLRVAAESSRERLGRLFEMERAAHAALTSCGWFFDDFGGPEGRVVLRWAARAVEIASEFTAGVEGDLLERLRQIRSNRREIGDAATLYLSLKTREARGRV